MINPRVYFSIHKNGYLLPIRTQNKELDNAFLKQSVINANLAAYNDYTRDFINKNKKSGDIYWSEEYEFSSETYAFIFYSLNVCDDDDYDKLATNVCEFDINKNYIYKTTNEPSISSDSLVSNIKNNIACPTIEETGFYIEEKKWYYIIRNIKKHINTMLIGPTGTGKTDIIQRIANKLNIELNIFDMGSMQDPMTGLLGTRDLIESKNANPISKFTYSRFVDAIQKPGIILLDELSRASQEANNILFPCLDNRRTLFVDIAPEYMDRKIKVHPECVFIATANIGAEYTGTTDIDAALLNRFLPLQLEYLPENIEIQVINSRTGISINNARKLVKFVNKVRSEYLMGKITKSVSTRETLAVAELIVDGFSVIDSIDFIITNKYMNNNYNDELTYIKKIIMGF